MIGWSLMVLALLGIWWTVMVFVAILLPNDVGRFIAYVRNGYDLWRDHQWDKR